MTERAFEFLPLNPRGTKPRTRGITEIRGPYSTALGGLLPRGLAPGVRRPRRLVRPAVDRYLRECRDFGFDTIEISAGFISLAMDDWLRLVEHTSSRARCFAWIVRPTAAQSVLRVWNEARA
jgi:phosphosulfolactate synthase (CoM biosynthesis protein A)